MAGGHGGSASQSETVAVFIGPHGMGPWHNEQMRVAIEDAVQQGKASSPSYCPAPTRSASVPS